MNKSTKVWLITAASAILVGIIIFGCAMIIAKGDFMKLSTSKLETNNHEINEDFSNISVKTDTADILFVLSKDGTCKVECYEDKKANHSVKVENDTLIIVLEDKRSWFDHIGINFSSPKITVYLPKTAYDTLNVSATTGDVALTKEINFDKSDISLSTGAVKCSSSVTESFKIKVTTGDVRIENTTLGSVDISVTTGNVNLSDVICKSFTSTGTTGDVDLKNTVASEKISINRSTGNIKFERCDAAEIFVKTATGNISGTLLSDKDFNAHSDTGHVTVPKNEQGEGVCEITTDTGDIRISIKH